MEGLCLPDAGHADGPSPPPEVMVQDEVNGRVDTTVEESQAAGEQEAVTEPR